MAAGLIFFVGREAVRTSRDTARRAAAAAVVQDTTPASPEAEPIAPATSVSLSAPRPASAGTTLDRAEVRRRISAGSLGTYVGDMLAERDSVLTRWAERTMEPVRVWVQRSSTAPDWNPDYAQVARVAFDEWGDVGAPVRFMFIVDSTRADIRVNFTERLEGGNRLGVTTHTHDRNGWIIAATIDIALHDSSGKAVPPPLIAAAARHEVGHALGLAHSRDRATIMFPESQTLSISGPDRATLKLLYTLPPGSVR